MLDGSNMTPGERLWHAVVEAGYNTYGAVFEQSFVQGVLGIEVPDIGTRKQFQRLDLLEVSAVDYVRIKLLDQGMALKLSDGLYRVPLPSENSDVIDNWLASANRKLRRADRLRRNTNATDPSGAPDQMAARILAHEEAIKSAKSHSSKMGGQ
jgi:hypothetical protein